jgi:hypothetical protein
MGNAFKFHRIEPKWFTRGWTPAETLDFWLYYSYLMSTSQSKTLIQIGPFVAQCVSSSHESIKYNGVLYAHDEATFVPFAASKKAAITQMSVEQFLKSPYYHPQAPFYRITRRTCLNGDCCIIIQGIVPKSGSDIIHEEYAAQTMIMVRHVDGGINRSCTISSVLDPPQSKLPVGFGKWNKLIPPVSVQELMRG